MISDFQFFPAKSLKVKVVINQQKLQTIPGYDGFKVTPNWSGVDKSIASIAKTLDFGEYLKQIQTKSN